MLELIRGKRDPYGLGKEVREGVGKEMGWHETGGKDGLGVSTELANLGFIQVEQKSVSVHPIGTELYDQEEKEVNRDSTLLHM